MEEPLQHDLDDDVLEERHQQPNADAHANRRAEHARQAAGRPERAEEAHRRRGYRAGWVTLRIIRELSPRSPLVASCRAPGRLRR